MDRNQAKEFYPILQAFAEGKVIETRTDPNVVGKGLEDMNDWTEMNEIKFWNNIEYRIKSEPKYRPFANVEECWTEMKKHQPFGWVKTIGVRTHFAECKSIGELVLVGLESTPHTYKYAFDTYTFADGTTFGVKVEE